MPRTRKVSNILKQHNPRLPNFNEGGDLVEYRSPGFRAPALVSGLAERLTWESCRQHIDPLSLWDPPNSAVSDDFIDVAGWYETPIPLVHLACMGIDLASQEAAAAKSSESSVESSDPREQVHKCELGIITHDREPYFSPVTEPG
jgi:hypothetical protein